MTVEYNVDLFNPKTGKRIKRLCSKISGIQLRTFWSQVKDIENDLEIRVYKVLKDSKSKLYKKKIYSIKEEIDKIFKQNLYYRGVDTSCEYGYNCNSYGCREEGICRSATIEKVNLEICVDSLIDNFIDQIIKSLKPYKLRIDKDILAYCLERTLKRYNLEDPEYYYVDKRHSYYGEEIFGIYLCGCNHDTLLRIIRGTTNDGIRLILENEYGYLLDDFKKIKTCKIQKVSVKDIVIPRMDRKLNKEMVDQYVSYKYPIGIYRKKGDKYSIIDGYHRYSALSKTNEELEIIVVE